MDENEIYNMYAIRKRTFCCCCFTFCVIRVGLGRMFQDTKSHLAIRWRNRRLADGTDRGMGGGGGLYILLAFWLGVCLINVPGEQQQKAAN